MARRASNPTVKKTAKKASPAKSAEVPTNPPTTATMKTAKKTAAKAIARSTVEKKTPTKAARSAPKQATSRASTRSANTGQVTRSRSGRASATVHQPLASASRIDRAVDQYRRLLETADRTARRRLIDAIAPESGPAHANVDLDQTLWGVGPTDAEVSAAELENVRLGFQRRREVATRSVTRDDAAGLLRISSQAVTDHLRHGDLAGLKDGKRWLIPLWQFDADCERGFLPGIAAVTAAFPGGLVSLSRWMTRPAPSFGGRTPRDELAAGNTDQVVAAAVALTATGW
jgi:Protein of unknown function (DUF2384)